MTMMWQMAIDNMIVENLSALSKPGSPSPFSVPCVYTSLVSHSLFEGVYLLCKLYFWLHWVFVAVHGLSPNSCGERGLFFIAVRGLLIVGPLWLQNTGSSAGFSNCSWDRRLLGSQVSLLCGIVIFLDQRLNWIVLADGFLSPVPPGKCRMSILVWFTGFPSSWFLFISSQK